MLSRAAASLAVAGALLGAPPVVQAAVPPETDTKFTHTNFGAAEGLTMHPGNQNLYYVMVRPPLQCEIYATRVNFQAPTVQGGSSFLKQVQSPYTSSSSEFSALVPHLLLAL